MSVVIAAALFAQLVVVGADPATCDRKAMVQRPVGSMSLRELLELMSRNDCVRYLVPAHLLDKRLEFGTSMRVIKDWRGPIQNALEELGISLHDERLQRVDGPPAPPSPWTPTDAELDRGITCASPGNCVVARKLFDRLLGDSAALATSVRIVPSLRDGKPDGFRLYALRPGTFLARIGFENGDTVQTLNGMDLSSPEKALEVYSKLRNAAKVAVRIVRRGQPLTLQLEIR